jgi:TonB-dependent receptor
LFVVMKPLIPTGSVAAAAACSLACAISPIQAGEAVRKSFEIAGGDAVGTLKRFADESGHQVIFLVDAVRGVTTNPVRGEYTVREALTRLVTDTGLVVVEDGRSGAFMVNRIASRELPPAPLPPKPKTLPMKPHRTLLTALLSLMLGPNPATLAADVPTGTIEGRIFNVVNGTYLNNARATLEGTGREERTNDFGEFRFDHVPVGPATVNVVVSGFPPKSTTVTVAAGVPTIVNVGLRLSTEEKASDEKVLTLDKFVVASQREINGSAIAINERRAAENLKNVVAADEFGDSPEGNVAELIKQMSGVAIGYNAADARSVSIRGLPAFGTAVSYDGAPIASGTSNPSRAAEFNQASLNNVARIEVIKSPLPDTRADTIGGSVNIVSKSAFEFSKPLLSYRTDLSANLSGWDGGNYYSLGKTPFSRGDNQKVLPGFDVSYIKPVNKNLGFTLSAATSFTFTPQPIETATWRPTQSATSLATADRPFLGSVGLQDGPKTIRRESLGGTVDWRMTSRDTLNLGFQWNWTRAVVDTDLQTFSVIGSKSVVPDSYSPSFTQSAAGAGSITNTLTTFDKRSPSTTVLLKYRHDGSVWQIESGVSFSESWSKVEAAGDGLIKSISFSAPNVTLRFDGIQDSIPRAITTQAATGGALDWGNLGNYRITSGTTGTPQELRNIVADEHASAARDFGGLVPFRLKIGADLRRQMQDLRNPTVSYTFVGPDKVANSADDIAANYNLVSASWSQISLPFGLGKTQRPASDKAYNLLVSHPEYWVSNDVTTLQSEVNNSQRISELVGAGFLRGDLSLLQNRLKLAGGVRYEATYDEGEGPLNDISRTYQRDATGKIVLGANGKPVQVTSDPLALARLQYVARGSHAKKHYGDFYPSLNASYKITEQLLFRASYARTITRPDLPNIIPSVTASDPTVSGSVPTITVNNTGLRPWYSNSFDLGLEYYFEKPGVISIGAFRKDISDFFGSTTSTITPAQLAEFGFDQSYANYTVVTKANIGSARVSGLESEYRQTLTWLPARFGNVIVYFNSTAIHVEGAAASSVSGFLPLTMNYGVTYSNSRLTVRVNWNQRGRDRNSQITGTNVDPATYNYESPRRNVDFNAEFRLTRYVALFANVRNITNVPWRLESYGPTTPAYARGTSWIEYGPNALFGVKGSF